MSDIVYPDFYDGFVETPQGNTTFGYFDDDQDFNEEAPKIVQYIASNLGFPVHKIEITLQQLYTCIESAVLEYAKILNNFRTKEEYFNMLGSEKPDNLSKILIKQNISSIVRMSDSYAVQAHVESGIDVYKDYIQTEKGKQVYDLKEWFQQKHSDETLSYTIKRVFHNEQPSVLLGRGGKDINDIGYQGWLENGQIISDGSYTLLPSSYNIARLQNLNTTRQIRFSSISFELLGGKIKVFPRPTQVFKLWFEYTLHSDEAGHKDVDEEKDIIQSPSDMNFDLYKWGAISKSHRMWIIKYALALATIQLGRNRRKFSSIPYASGDITLDGDSLVNEGISETERLRIEFKEELQELSYERGVEIKRVIADNQQEILNKIPIPLVRG